MSSKDDDGAQGTDQASSDQTTSSSNPKMSSSQLSLVKPDLKASSILPLPAPVTPVFIRVYDQYHRLSSYHRGSKLDPTTTIRQMFEELSRAYKIDDNRLGCLFVYFIEPRTVEKVPARCLKIKRNDEEAYRSLVMFVDSYLEVGEDESILFRHNGRFSLQLAIEGQLTRKCYQKE